MPDVHERLTTALADLYTICANLAGIPGISVPSGFTADDKPLGLQLLGPQQADVHVCQIAQAYADATRFAERSPNEC